MNDPNSTKGAGERMLMDTSTDEIVDRIIKGFMNQGGDPEGTGSGGPG